MARRFGMSKQDFYWSLDPLEEHARGVTEAVIGELGKKRRISSQRYSEIFERFLDKAIESARRAEEVYR